MEKQLSLNEQIEDIAESIKRHRDLEITCEITNKAIGRTFTLYDKEEQQFWLILNAPERVEQKDFLGNVIPEYGYSKNTPYKGSKAEGFPIPRDSKLGAILIQNHEGIHNHKVPNREIEIIIYNRASYLPSNAENEYATDVLIRLAGDSKTHAFKDIAKILELQHEIDQERKKLEQVDDNAKNELLKSIEQKEENQKEYINKVQNFIRKYAELRFQPILDPIQDAIRRSEVFKRILIINGGPGTGKTTSLIQRIKFLISPTIEEEIKLTKDQKDILFNQKTSWIFYSPNELLALFLRNSMKMEELIADNDRVKVWNSHKNELIKSYKLVDTQTKNPFMIYNKSQGNSLIKNTPNSIKSINKGFEEFYFNFQKEKIEKVIEIDVSPFKWKNTGKSIINYLQERKDIKKLEDFIRLFLNLNEQFKTESDKISEEYPKYIKDVAARIQLEIKKDDKRSTNLSVILNGWKNTAQEIDEDEEYDTEIEQEDFDEKEEQTIFDFERELFSKLKAICRKQALKQFDKNIKFTKRDKELIELISEVNKQPEYEQIGQIAFFKKYFERITKGIVANILREIPMNYKKFRREQFKRRNKNYNFTILEELVKKDENKRIHSDEQAFLLFFVNNICSTLSKGYKKQYQTLSHPYINAYKINCKPVIGIDEATDFSLIDLLAISSFGHPDISSITLSGDVMQRMTSDGLKSWEDLISLKTNKIKFIKRDLEVSYRQSPTLLSLAQQIYKKSMNKDAAYKSYIERDETEPKPLMFISDDENEKLNWIAERIIEIHNAYIGSIDSIPSIAVFLPEESLLENFARKLGDLDALADVGIRVKACRDGEVLGDKNTVRVFSIDKIKGLEFETVFFHNLDSLQDKHLPDELLLKYLYVGLSRATFYLGLTLNNKFSDNLNFLESNFDKSGKTWRI